METSKRKFKKVAIGLSISIVLNLLFIGIFVGQQMHMGHNRFMQKAEIEAFHQKIEQSEKMVEAAMLKDPYDKQAVLDALNAFDMQTQEIRTAFHKKIADEAASLPPQERLKLIPWRFRHQGFFGGHN